MLKEINKKKFLGFFASALIALGSVFGAYNIFTNYKEKVIETELLEAAQKYVEGEQISISDTYMVSSETLINKKLLKNKEAYNDYSVKATNNEGELEYEVTTESITDLLNDGSDIEIPVFSHRIILSNDKPTKDNVSVQIILSHSIELSGTSVVSGNNTDEWELSEDGKLLTKTFTENGEENLTVDTAISLRPMVINVQVTNIDKEPIKVTGVEDGGRYPTDVTVIFDKGTALLNGKEFTSGTTISTDGNYTLKITHEAGHEALIKFVVAKNPATTDSVQNGAYYTEPVTITFPDNVTATLDGKDFTSGTEVSKEGKRTLVLTNPAGVETVIEFTIDLTDPSVVTFAPASTDKTNVNVTVDLVFSEDVKITSINPNYQVTGSGKTYQVIATDNGIITVNYEDLAGRPGTEASYEVTNIDRTPATVTIRSKETNPTNKSIQLVLEANEAVEIIESNANFVKYNDAAKKYTVNVTANGTYTARVKDLAGNESTASIVVTNYDKDKPVVELVRGEKNKKLYNLESITPVITDANTYTTALTKDGSEVEYTGTITEEGVYVLTVTDAAGNVTTVNFIVDRTKPVVKVGETELTDGKTYYYNKNVKFTYTDAYKPSATIDGENYKSGSTFNITDKEGSHTLIVTDLTGNTTTINFIVDTEPLTATVTPSIPLDTPTNQNVELTITVNKNVEITNTNKEGIVAVDGTLDGFDTNVFKMTATKNNKAVILKFRDKAGNTGSISYTATNIDKNKPVVELIEGQKNKTYYKSTLKPTITDENSYDVELTKDGNIVEYNGTIEAEGVYSLTVTDAAGNVTTVNFTIDKTKPTASVDNVLMTDGALYNKDIRIVLNDNLTEVTATLDGVAYTSNTLIVAAENEGNHVLELKDSSNNKVTINFTIDATAPKVIDIIPSTIELTNKNITVTFKFDDKVIVTNQSMDGITVSEDGKEVVVTVKNNKNVIVKFKDEAGNTGSASYEVTNIDKTKPTIVVDGVDETGIVYVELGDDTFTLPTATVTDNRDGVLEGTVAPTYTTDKNVEVTKEGRTVVTYSATDEAGNTREVEVTFIVQDTKAPIVTTEIKNSKAIDAITGWSKEDLIVQINATDASAMKYEYMILAEGVEAKWIEVTDPEFTLDINSSDIQYVVRVTDKSESEHETTVYSTSSYKIDKQNPSIDTNEIKSTPKENGWYKDLNVEVTASDILSGIAKVEYKVSTDNGTTYSEYALATLTDGVYKFAISVEESGKLIYKVRVTDKAGNKVVSEASETIKLDTKLPTVTSITRTPEDTVTPTKEDVVFTIVMSENVTFDNADVKTVEGEDNTYKITFKENTKEDVVLNYTDKAGNPGEAITLSVSNIDKTAPVITVDGIDEKDTIKVELGDTTFVLPEGSATDNVDTTVTVTRDVETIDVNTVGTTTITYTATDVAGNKAEKIIKVKVQDTTEPTVTFNVTSESTPVNNWFNKNIKVQVNATDLSGIKEIRYAVLDSDTTSLTPVKLEDGKTEFTISNESANISFIVEVEDNEGNVATLVNGAETGTLDSYNLDKTKPVIDKNEITTEAIKGQLYNSDLTIEATASDALSGVNKFEYSTTINGVTTDYVPVPENGIININVADGTKAEISYTLKVTDNAGNFKTSTVSGIVVDKEKATITEISRTPDVTVTNTDVVIKFTSSEELSEIEEATKVEGEVNTYEIKFTENGSKTITFKDTAKNEGEYTFTVSNIDKTAPVISVDGLDADKNTIKVELGDTTFVVPSASALDNRDGVVTVSKDVETVDVNTVGTTEVTYTATDEAGNTAERVVKVSVQDTTAPTVTLDITSESTPINGWYNKDINVHVNATDLSAIKKIEYFYFDTEIGETVSLDLDNPEFTISENKQGIQFLVIVTDEYDNVTEIASPEAYNLDKKAPTVKHNISTEAEWYTDNITVNVNAKDTLSRVASATYRLSTDGVNYTSPIALTGIVSEDGSIDYSFEIGDGYESETLYYEITITDNAGNPKTIKSEAIKFDKTAPTITVTDPTDNSNLTEGFTKYIELGTVDVFTSMNVTGTDNVTSTEDLEITKKGENKVEVTKVGEYKVTYKVKDLAGNHNEINGTIVVQDTKAPTVRTEITNSEAITSYGWSKEALKVNIIGEDQNGLTNRLEYYYIVFVDGVSTTEDFVKLPEGTTQFTIDGNSDNISYYVKVVDEGKNEADEVSGVYKIDKDVPVINTNEIKNTPNEAGWYRSVDVEVTASDILSGIAKVEYKLSIDGANYGEYKEATLENGVYKFNFATTEESTTLVYKVRVTDKAGNKVVSEASETIKIDPENPTVTSITRTPEDTVTPTKEDVVFTIVMSENVTFDNANVKVVEGEDNTYKITFKENTENDVVLNYTDKAGNPGEAITLSVSNIDKTAPVITVDGIDEKDTIKVELGDTDFVLPEGSATDNVDTTVTVTRDVETVDVNTVGTTEVTYTATDEAGNTAERVVKVKVQDTTAPTVTLDVTSNSTPINGWYNKDINVHVNATDLSDIKKIEYFYFDTEIGETVSLDLDNPEFTISENKKGIQFVVIVTDEYDNETEVVSEVAYNLDKTKPVIDKNEITTEAVKGQLYNSDLTIEAVASDALSGVNKFEYSTTINGVTTDYAPVPENGIINISVADGTRAEISYTLKVTDNAGNFKTSTVSGIVVDKEKATITEISRTPDVTVTNTDVVIRFTSSEELSEIEGATKVEGEVNTYEIKFTENGSKTISFKDTAKNEGEYTFTVSNIDKTAPVISVDGLDADKNTIKVELGDTTFVVPSASALDNRDGVVTVSKDAETVDVNTVGTTEVTYTATDEAGNTAERVVKVKVQDTTAPTVTLDVTSNSTPINGWYNKDINVHVNATDLSDIKKIEYFYFDTEIGETVSLDLDNPEFTISENKQGIQFLVIVTDEYDNVTEIASEEAYSLDKKAPTITTNIVEGTLEDNGFYTTNITVEASAEDTLSGLAELYYAISYDGGKTYPGNWKSIQNNGTFIIDGESEEITYMIRAIDRAGNAINKTIRNIKIDKTDPVINVDGLDAETNTMTVELGDKSFTIPTATATDTKNGQIVPVNVTVKGTVDVDVVDDYEITYTAKDEAGNTTIRKVTISVVDTTNPEVSIVVKNAPNKYGWHKDYLDVEISATDLSEIKGYFYKVINNDVTPDEWTEARDGKFTVSSEGSNIKFIVKVIDKYNNETIKTSNTYGIDMTKPTVSAVIPAANSYGYYTGNVTIEVNGTDTLSGIDYYEYATKTEDGWTEWTLVEDGEFTLTETTKFKVRSVDKAGLTSDAYKSDEIKIDKSLPTLENITRTPEVGTNPINTDVVFTFTPSEEITYILNGEKIENNTITFTENGSVKVEFVDVAGNKGEYTFIVSDIDKTAPVVTGVEDKGVYTTNVAPTFNEGTATLDGEPYTSGTLVSAEGSHKLVVEDTAGNKTKVNFIIDKTAPVITVTDLEGNEHTSDFSIDINIEDTDSWQNLEYTITDAGTAKKDLIETVTGEDTVKTNEAGTYTITYNATDKGGFTTTLTVTVNVYDTVPPTVNYNIVDYKEGWINNQVQVELSGTDKGTGIKSYEYALIIDGVEGSWQEVSKNSKVFTISNNSANIKFKVRSKDGAGLYSDVLTSTETLKIDTTVPTVSSTINSTANANGWYKDDIEVSVSGEDTLSGLDYIEYSVKLGTDNWSKWTKVKDGKFSITDASSEITYKVRSVDNAGNTSVEFTSETLKLDTTKPVIKVQNGAKEETKDFSITLEADKNVTEFNYPTATVTDNDKTVTVTRSGNVNMKLLDTPQEVIYTATDIAGNNTTVKMTVTIKDTTAPTVKLKSSAETTIKYGESHNVSASDIEVSDNFDLNPRVDIESNLDIYTPDTYIIKYVVTDQSGKTTTITRKVIVTVTNTSEVILPSGVTSTGESCKAGADCYITNGDNNYVWYSGHLWRIIKVNADNTVKLVTEEVVAGFSYDDDSSAFTGSYAEKWLQEEFYRELNNASQIVVESDYCNEQLNSLKKKRYSCSDSAKVRSNVALLTIDEYNILGGINSYLNNGTRFHTMTPTGPKTAFIVEEEGTKEYNLYVNEPYGMRPVITTKAIDITKGTGTKNDPYHIKGDNKGTKGNNLNSRVSGEYVTFANQTWRIVETLGTGTKLIYDGYYQTNGVLERRQFGPIKFTTSDGIGSYLNNEVYNSLFKTTAERNAISKFRWYNNEYHIGDNPLDTTLKSSSNYVDAYVGLVRVGELMSGNSTTGTISDVSSWTMNNNGSKVWQTSWAGTTDIIGTTEDYRSIRPVIVLNSNITINGGNGTSSSPYSLQLAN